MLIELDWITETSPKMFRNDSCPKNPVIFLPLSKYCRSSISWYFIRSTFSAAGAWINRIHLPGFSPWRRRAWHCGRACGSAAWWRPPPGGSCSPRLEASRSASCSRSGTSPAGRSHGLEKEKNGTQSVAWVQTVEITARYRLPDQ